MPGPSMGELVERLGRHPASLLGLELAAPGGPERWLLAACVLAGRGSEARRLAWARELAAAGLDAPAALRAAGAEPVAASLTAAGHRDAKAVAARLLRASESLTERHGGSLAALAAEADGLEELGARLAALAPGLGPATVARFLRPLRDLWPDAAGLPLEPATLAAAIHLGWVDDGADTGDAAAALRSLHRRQDDAPPFADVEAALARLGARACLRSRTDRCPLQAACPARSGGDLTGK